MPSRSRKFDVVHGETSDVKLSPRGDILAAAAWQAGKVTLYDFPGMEPRVTWRAHGADLQALAFSPNGRYLATTSADRSAKIWRVKDQCLRAVLRSPEKGLYAVAFSPDGQTLATTSNEAPFDVYLWDVSALEE